MRYCTDCGKPGTLLFCSNCGKALGQPGPTRKAGAQRAEPGLPDPLASARDEARKLRQVQTEAGRRNAAIARAAAALSRRQARRELFASKRFRLSGLVGAGVALAAVMAPILLGLINEAETAASEAEKAAERAASEAATAASEAERAGLLENLPETYLRTVDDCAVSTGIGDSLSARFGIEGTTLILRYRPAGTEGDDFVDCVTSALTGRSASGLDPLLPQERGDFILLKGETGASITIRPTR